MKKILLLPLLFVVFQLSAAPIGEKRAKELAVQFFVQNQGVSADEVKVKLEWGGHSADKKATARTRRRDLKDALIYIYNRTDKDGYVILAGDDKAETVLAFAFDNTFDIKNMPETARMLLSGYCSYVEQRRNSPR
jgi:hypothetical protein